jgi:hypothetical protein
MMNEGDFHGQIQWTDDPQKAEKQKKGEYRKTIEQWAQMVRVTVREDLGKILT